MNALKVVHVAMTPLAGSPLRIVNALNQFTPIDARLVVLDAHAYGDREFAADIDWSQDREQALTLLRQAEIVHLHHFFELEENNFNINFNNLCPRARFVRQFHTHPVTIARGDRQLAQRIVNSEIPQLVIAQYHERHYPRARLVPNIVPLADDLYQPVSRNGIEPVLFFAPTVENSMQEIAASATRWETKGAPETERLLNRVVEICGIGRVAIRRNIPHEQCLREKRAADLAIDEMVTGSYHLSSLESLAQGLPTFAYVDSRTQETLAELTGTSALPWLNFRLEEAEGALIEVIKDSKLRLELGLFSREWMEKYYNDREMVQHYVRAYQDLMERPESFRAPRFDTGSRCQVFLAQHRDDLVWEKRKTRLSNENSFVSIKTHEAPPLVEKKMARVLHWIKAPVHDLLRKYTSVRIDEIQLLEQRLEAAQQLLEFVVADDPNLWLYKNRDERMDATLDVFDEKRRKFHLDRYCFAAERVKGMRVLDCACGTGYGVRMLRELGGASYVVGIDCEPKAIEYAFKKHRINGTVFFCSSGDQLALPDACVDIVTSFETIEHVADDVALLKEVHRVLRPGGTLIISTPNQWPLSVSPYHLREYDRRAFIELLASFFTCIELYNQNSGSESPFNHGQAPGITATTEDNENLAECFIAVCRAKTFNDR